MHQLSLQVASAFWFERYAKTRQVLGMLIVDCGPARHRRVDERGPIREKVRRVRSQGEPPKNKSKTDQGQKHICE